MMLAVFHRISPVDSVGPLRAVLRYTVDLTGGTTRTPAERRRGRTARWPASLLPTRFGGRLAGLWLRIGARAWWFAVVHRQDVLTYRR